MRSSLNFFLVLLFAVCARGVLAAPLNIFVSVLPQKAMVERIGGDQVRVSVMVSPGHNPASYEPSPRQVVALAAADLYVRIGVPFESAWLGRIRSANPDMPLWDMRGPAPDQGGDPHVWTDPVRVQAMAVRLRDRLSVLRPQQQTLFEANAQAYANELAELDAELTARFAPYQGRSFLVFHPAWGYFAQRYGLRQLAVEHEGKEPGPKAMQRLIVEARDLGLTTIFVEPQFHHHASHTVAEGFAGKAVQIDPLAPDLVANLRAVSLKIVESMQP